jgi:D-tyrosyl-tRNA(Tyr) deacylase
MRAVVQRVSRASVSVDGAVRGQLDHGLLVLVGVAPGDTALTARRMAAKAVALRIFEDPAGRMNLDVGAVGGAVLCVSQFTLYGDVRRGNRPSFSGAAEPALAEEIYEAFCLEIERLGLRCGRGVFGAHMEVAMVNDGPVTILLDSDDLDRPRR